MVAARTAFVLDPQQAAKLAGEPNELSMAATKREPASGRFR